MTVSRSDGLTPFSVTAGAVLDADVGDELPHAAINSPAATAIDTSTSCLTWHHLTLRHGLLMLDSMLIGISLWLTRVSLLAVRDPLYTEPLSHATGRPSCRSTGEV